MDKYKVAQRFWGKVKEENTVADSLQYFKCSYGDGYVIDQNRLPEGKHKFVSFAGSYIIHSSDWKELVIDPMAKARGFRAMLFGEAQSAVCVRCLSNSACHQATL